MFGLYFRYAEKAGEAGMGTTKTIIAVVGAFIIINLMAFSCSSASDSKKHPYKGVIRELIKLNIFLFVFAAIMYLIFRHVSR